MTSWPLKKEAPPILTADMIQPVDAPIPTAAAKHLFKEWMIRIGYLSNNDRIDRMELADHVGYFADAMREHEEYLRFELENAKENWQEEIAENKAELKELRRDLAKCSDPAERADLESDISVVEFDLAGATTYIDKARRLLATFKADKREFLVDYINTQVHGRGWKAPAKPE